MPSYIILQRVVFDKYPSLFLLGGLLLRDRLKNHKYDQ